MENIQKNIGKNLKAVRNNRGISLDQTASLTGVSKAMLGQIERGESNPTVTTLWKIATGLQVSFSSLINDEPADIAFVPLQNVSPVIENNGDYRVYSIFSFDPRKRFEIFIVEMDRGSIHTSERHNEGVEEYITVMNGSLEMLIGDNTYQIEAGGSIRFTANKSHTYKNSGEEMIRYQAVMYYP
ncbi:DNA-binding protein [Bacillus canaveralius]|uniref:DNA-binding protein n=1 Tax=Bacillus canaveralius TaxID=1403243 RepID=A0A2N5GPI0_9BACI|nr:MULTISPECIES: XRE family transcriptional regulator [Bacillus]PLR84620.1 DNA-binding protein [Bacillus canaveralius]PLR87353.1 DNA-binding protein [Bacillus sp. V33-4]PLS00772.1 DNA-binding protein [Bacillus canaveralius]RSK53303.1 XRE family transcriptional regulator [Bacillus canaveralius]